MAIFSEEEYQDQARIRRGYDRIYKSLIPYPFDSSYSNLRQIIRFRDHTMGIETQRLFSVVDFVDENIVGTPSRQSSQYFADLVGSSFETKSLTAQGLMDQMIQESKANGDSVVIKYLLSPDGNTVVGSLALKEGVLYSYVPSKSLYGATKWDLSETEVLYNEYFPQEYSWAIVSDLSRALKSAGYEAKEVINKDGIVEYVYDFSLITDQGIFREEILVEDSKQFDSVGLGSREVQTICLMATQNLVEPCYEFSDNIPSTKTIRELIGEDRVVQGNCVEQSVALAINSLGGLDGRFVHPRYRVKPSQQALQQPEPRFSFDDLDPLHDQSLSRRLFGDGYELLGNGTLAEQNLGETGATVAVPGHQFFAKEINDQIYIYDAAMSFFGTYETYNKFLDHVNISSTIKSMSPIVEIDREKAKFYDRCREPYLSREVQDAARNIFSQQVPSQRNERSLYNAWSQAVALHPEYVAQALNYTDSRVDYEKLSAQDQEPIVDTGKIIEMIDSQESGFVCIKSNYLDHPNQYAILIKDGENLMMCAGEFSTPIKNIQDALSKNPDFKYSAVSFGGNNLSRMAEIRNQGIEVVKTNTKNADPLVR